MHKKFLSLPVLVFIVLALSCGGGGSGGGQQESGDCTGGGWCGEQAISVTANVGGAEALFIQNTSGSVLGNVSAEKAITVSSESPLFSVTTSGVTSVLAAAYRDNSSALSGLPKLSFVAVSPIGHVVLVFEHSFIFTETAADGTRLENYSDPWSPSSPFTCQIFVVDKKLQNVSSGEAPGLTCLTTGLEINTWDSRAAMIQFDGNGKVYFTAHVPQNWKNVLLKWTPGTDDASTAADESVSGTLAETINANICFREYLVTNEGGVLYTGITSTSGDCNGTSFLRYLTPANELQEITSGWWEYVFQPIESTLFTNANISPNITTANIGQILFYGPDPEIATTPDWEDACLFKFNPDASGEARSMKIADCDIDVWRYVDWADSIADQKTRCTEIKSMMGGGNIPQKIMLADLNNDGSNYEIYVSGQMYEKKAGEWRCNIRIEEAHCLVNSKPNRTYIAQGACETANGTWTATTEDYDHITKDNVLNYDACTADHTNWQINGQWCESPGGDWRDIYNALAWVIHSDPGTPADDDDDTKQIVRLSDNDEIVKNAWVVDNTLVYSSFESDTGTYKLRKAVWTDADADRNVDTTDGADDDTVPDEITKTDLLTGIEVYELFADPRSNHPGEWFFNGLRFNDNQYITGTFNPTNANPSSTLRTEADITGQIETLVIVPNF